MPFLEHIPGTNPLPRPEKHARAKGIGILGLHEGRTLLLALDRVAHARVVAGCDLDDAKLASARAEASELFYTQKYSELLARPEVDVVAIYTPDAQHGAHVEQAFEAGKDVICT